MPEFAIRCLCTAAGAELPPEVEAKRRRLSDQAETAFPNEEIPEKEKQEKKEKGSGGKKKREEENVEEEEKVVEEEEKVEKEEEEAEEEAEEEEEEEAEEEAEEEDELEEEEAEARITMEASEDEKPRKAHNLPKGLCNKCKGCSMVGLRNISSVLGDVCRCAVID